MVGPMPMALGCLAGGREMRQVGVAIKCRGVGTSAGSGRGDDRGLTHGPDIAAENRMVPMCEVVWWSTGVRVPCTAAHAHVCKLTLRVACLPVLYVGSSRVTTGWRVILSANGWADLTSRLWTDAAVARAAAAVGVVRVSGFDAAHAPGGVYC